jgi:hypothetical protein
MKEGLCLYCAEKGHMVPDCPQLPSNRKQTGRATFTVTPATKEEKQEPAKDEAEST